MATVAIVMAEAVAIVAIAMAEAVATVAMAEAVAIAHIVMVVAGGIMVTTAAVMALAMGIDMETTGTTMAGIGMRFHGGLVLLR